MGLRHNGHKLRQRPIAMAQDIRYPGGRVGKASGPQIARLAWLRDANSMLTITIMGLSHYPRHGHGLELWPCLGLAQGKIQRPTANGHRPRHSPRYRYPWVRVGRACGPRTACLGRKSYTYHYHTNAHRKLERIPIRSMRLSMCRRQCSAHQYKEI